MSELLGEAQFLPTGYYIRIWDVETKTYCFYHLTEREGPKRYPITFEIRETTGVNEDTPDGEYAKEIIFKELNPKKEPVEHIHQCFVGACAGILMHVRHPYKKRILEWDQTVEGPTTEIPGKPAIDVTRAFDYEISPYEYPRFELWITRNRYFALQPYVTAGKAITPEALILGMAYAFEEITEDEYPELYDKLRTRVVKSYPTLIGGLEE